ncbi:WD repeat domain phosphoinositide-interacting protein 2-like [Cloeon dipterum]|uniref:WD repeat domain phosphoinositide-interacting protein 2-like n=1 Tax=Cloeon dipterum TaxID=197152 RepID=UPI00321FFC3D
MTYFNSTKRPNNLAFVRFSGGSRTLAVSSDKASKVYNVLGINNVKLIYENASCTDAVCLERLNTSNLLAIVRVSNPKQVDLFEITREDEPLYSFEFETVVLDVKLNSKIMVICLEESIVIQPMENLRKQYKITDLWQNYNGVCALGKYLAYPSSSYGELHLFDIDEQTVNRKISVPDGPLVVIEFSSKGDYLATASEKGTLIWVYETNSGEMLWQFRRGAMRCASVYSLSFSQDNKFLCCSSNTETVHVFQLQPHPSGGDSETNAEVGWLSWASSFLPSFYPEDRSFAMARLLTKCDRTTCCIKW